MEDKRYPITLEVITPLCVGAGNDNEWVKGIDYVQKDGKVYVIDMQKVASAGIDVDALAALFLKSDEAAIAQLLGNRIAELSRYVFDSPVRTPNNIKTFLRTQLFDKPLVAGSSIKGSLRSALFNYLRTNEDTNEAVFGTMKDGTDFMRFVRVGDIEMPSTLLVNTKIFNLRGNGNNWQGGWKHQGTDREGNSHTTHDYNPVGFNTLYECVSPGQKGYGNISLASAAFSLLETFGQGRISYASKKRALLNEPICELFQIINEVTKAYLIKERDFFEKYHAERSDELLDCIGNLLSMIPSDGSSCLLKMSAGVGFHSITGDWQFEDYDNTGQWTGPRNAGKKKYKSRKIAEYNHHLQLMGFVKLRQMTADEVQKSESSLGQSHQAILNGILEKCQIQEDLHEEAKRKELEREAAKKEARQRQEEYARLMDETNRCMLAEQWDKAMELAQKALDVTPSSVNASTLIADARHHKEIAQFQESERQKGLETFAQPLSRLLKSKSSSIGNLLGTTTKWLKANNGEFGEEEYKAILNALPLLPDKEKKNIQKKRKDFAKCMGETYASRLFEELSNL